MNDFYLPFLSGNGDPPALRNEIERAMNGLAATTAALDSTIHLGEADWEVVQETGTIVFSHDRVRAEAPVQIIGTFNTLDSTWLWAWNNPSILPALTENARRLRAYGDEHKYADLMTSKIRCTEERCWEFTALAFLLCSENCAYRGPAGTALVFMTFGELHLNKAV